MEFEGKYNTRSPAVKRLMREACELREATDQYWAHPLDDNLFEWHFTVRGPPGTDFEGGIYHGRIILPPEYPMKPPNIILLTPNGRFEINKKICLSISGHHPETWQPSWSIRTALLAIVAFMPTPGDGTIGSLDYTPEERQALARRSCSWCCPECGDIKAQLASKYSNSGEEESQAVKPWSSEERAETEGLRQRSSSVEQQNNSLEQAELTAVQLEEGQAGSQGNALILFLLVAIALLLYRRIFLLE
ncbi:hypothetical protein B566_EDAN004022 [Ephemera danica]|nr:hypothetical protein B566_EDAN004022 [Ephemera danica]